MQTLKFSPAILLLLALFAGYVAYRCYLDARAAEQKATQAEQTLAQYQADSKSLQQLEINLLKAIKDGQNLTSALRADVAAGRRQLLVKTEELKQNRGADAVVIQQTLQLAESARQDYYALRDGLEQNRLMILGWQDYYCSQIAPKNQTEHLCAQMRKWR